MLGIAVAKPLSGQTPAPTTVPTSTTTPAAQIPATSQIKPNKPFPKPPPGITVERDIVIGQGGNRDLHVDIAYPTNATGPLPAVIYIHGGGWESGNFHYAPIFLLAQAGYFAVTVDYRLLGEAHWPAQIQDCKLGVRWLRANAAKYNVNPNRIGAWGESAGGHLVACLGTMSAPEDEGTGGYPGVSSSVQAVADFFGPTDFIDPAMKLGPGYHQVEKLLGVKLGEQPDLWKSASPVAFVKAGDPPFLIIHGDADTTVPLPQSIELDAALTKAGVPHQFVVVKNGRHGLFPVPGTQIQPSRAEITMTLAAFFAKYLKGP